MYVHMWFSECVPKSVVGKSLLLRLTFVGFTDGDPSSLSDLLPTALRNLIIFTRLKTGPTSNVLINQHVKTHVKTCTNVINYFD